MSTDILISISSKSAISNEYKMPHPGPSERPSNHRSGSGIVKARQRHQQLACDRCRGQKLRCIRATNLQSPCERCQKAGATCVVDPSVRMGRPQRTHKGQETVNKSRRSQQECSPKSPLSNFTSLETASKDNASNSTPWLDPRLEEAIDLSLVGVHYQGPLDFELHNDAVEEGQLQRSLEESYFGGSFDFDSLDTPRNFANPDALGTGTGDRGGSTQPSHYATFESIEASKVPSKTPDAKGIVGDNIWTHTVSKQQDSVEKISSLNLELRRQISIVSGISEEPIHPDPSQGGLLDESNSLSCAIVLMIQALQSFQELLLEVLGPTPPKLQHETMDSTARRNSHQPIRDTTWPRSKACCASLLSLSSSEDTALGESRSEREARPRMVTHSGTGLQSRATEETNSDISLLDMPTSLLVISCYINLIHLCRQVFAAIRDAITSSDPEARLVTLSGFQISGVSIHDDSDLQIIVLTQVVVRLVDRIGLSLGRSYTPTVEVGSLPGVNLSDRAIQPQLLEFVLKQDGVGGQPFGIGGIKALREEIRRLNDVVYKPV